MPQRTSPERAHVVLSLSHFHHTHIWLKLSLAHFTHIFMAIHVSVLSSHDPLHSLPLHFPTVRLPFHRLPPQLRATTGALQEGHGKPGTTPPTNGCEDTCDIFIPSTVQVLREGRMGGARDFKITGYLKAELVLICTDEKNNEELTKMYGPLCWEGYDNDPGGFKKIMWFGITK